MKILFHSHAYKIHFHMKGCALGLILKVRVFGTRKWPIMHQSIPAASIPTSRSCNCKTLCAATPLHYSLKRSIFIPIPKKGDLKECTNYRTISLISHASKIMSKIIQKKKCAKLPCEQRIFLWPVQNRQGSEKTRAPDIISSS